jgi:hypothetical protein
MMQNPAVAEDLAQCLVEPGTRNSERAMTASSPFVIGVTGHRYLAEGDLARARSAVASFFDTIRQLLPDTELNVLLGMAAGGDLLVAETALALGIHVEALLPMPLAEFVSDFDDRNRRLLMELLDHRNLRYIELPPPARGESSPLADATAAREAAYRNLTEVLNRKSNLLLALWDGKASRRPGGTTDTVLRCLRVLTDDKALRLQFTAADPGADTDSPFVYWMPIAPGGNDESVAAISPCFLTGLGDTILQFGSQPPEALRRRLNEFNDYNRDFGRVSADVRTAPSDSLLARVPAELLGADRPRLAAQHRIWQGGYACSSLSKTLRRPIWDFRHIRVRDRMHLPDLRQTWREPSGSADLPDDPARKPGAVPPALLQGLVRQTS